jgi:hypothetical protein
MTNAPLKRLAQRFLFSALLAFLAVFGISNAYTGAKSAAACKQKTALICCSACEVENPPLACRHGCSPSCKTSE